VKHYACWKASSLADGMILNMMHNLQVNQHP